MLMMIVPTELRTERLLLRPFRAGDVDDALAYRNDAEFSRYLPHIPYPFERRHAEAFVALNMSESWETSPTFAIVFEGRVIGTVNLEVDVPARAAMLGYAIGRAWWGRGIATEAARAVMAWGIETYGLTRIWASAELGNVRSHRVLEKLGMQREKVVDGEVDYGLAVVDLPMPRRTP
jgi:ribosomal-protein-alanine N-acetyltransferase